MRFPSTTITSAAKRPHVRLLTLCLVVFVSFAPTSRAAIERTVERSFVVSAGCIVKIDTCQGAIRIEPSPDGQLHLLIRETLPVEDEPAADRGLRDLDLKIEQTATRVAVKARYRRVAHWFWESWPPVAMAYVVKVPPSCALDLVTAEGDITVGAFQGTLLARTDSGAIFTGEITGTVQATSARGDVSVTACSGELTLNAKSGNVLVGRAAGTTRIHGVGGTIEVQSARGNLRVDGDGADLKIGFAHPLTESAVLHAAGGDIEVAFDPRSACTLSASASTFGAVKSKDLPLKIEAGKIGSARVLATLNAGGPKIVIEASGGNVWLNGSSPVP